MMTTRRITKPAQSYRRVEDLSHVLLLTSKDSNRVKWGDDLRLLTGWVVTKDLSWSDYENQVRDMRFIVECISTFFYLVF